MAVPLPCVFHYAELSYGILDVDFSLRFSTLWQWKRYESNHVEKCDGTVLWTIGRKALDSWRTQMPTAHPIPFCYSVHSVSVYVAFWALPHAALCEGYTYKEKCMRQSLYFKRHMHVMSHFLTITIYNPMSIITIPGHIMPRLFVFNQCTTCTTNHTSEFKQLCVLHAAV